MSSKVFEREHYEMMRRKYIESNASLMLIQIRQYLDECGMLMPQPFWHYIHTDKSTWRIQE